MRTFQNNSDTIDTIYQNINLLTIKKTVKQLSELDDELLASFVEKYSAVMIFFLNILDKDLSLMLLHKLREPSIIHIAEEEMRMILIGEIAKPETNFEDISLLSEYMDGIERRDEVSNEAAEKMSFYFRRVSFSGKNHFNYLYKIDEDRLRRFVHILGEWNPHILFSLSFYASPGLVRSILHYMSFYQKHLLRYIPAKTLRLWIEECGERVFQIKEHLPEEIIRMITRVKEMREYLTSHFHVPVIDKVYESIKELEPDLRELILVDLKKNKVIQEKDAGLLKVLFEK